MKSDEFMICNRVVHVLPPKAADENATTDLYEPFSPRASGLSLEREVYHRYGEGSFSVEIGGTTFDVSTHFSTEGTESVLQQFKALILSEQLF